MHKGKIEIWESYKDYSPPYNVSRILQRIIDVVPSKFLARLSHIVLTNTESLSHDRRRMKIWIRGKKYSITESFGLYYPKWDGNPAYIEIFVNNVVNYYPPLWLKLPFYRNIVFADVFYHELGHHLQQTILPEYRDGERVAEEWTAGFLLLFIKREYWYIYPFLYLLDFLRRIMKKLLKRT